MSKEAIQPNTVDTDATEKQILIAKQTIAAEILQEIYTFFRATELHEPGNRIFANILSSLHHSMTHWVQAFDLSEIELSLKGEQFFLNDRRIRPKPRSIKKLKSLVKYFRSRGIVGFKAPKELRIEDLHAFLWCLLAVKKGDSAVKVAEDLRAKGLEGFEIKALNWGELKELEQADSAAEVIYAQLHEMTKSLFAADIDQKSQGAAAQTDQILYELNSISDEELIRLVCTKTVQVTEFSFSHLAVMTAMTLHGWGKALGLPPFAVVELAAAGLAHPLTLLHAPQGSDLADPLGVSRLSILFSNIQRIRKVWPLTDLQILTLTEFPISFGEKGVYEVNGRQCYQHFFSRMLRIVVLFQRFISPDRRRENLTASEAINRLLTQEMGCDPTLVKLFVSWMGIFPMGSFVKLASGEIGQVCSTNLDLSSILRPQVHVLTDAAGKPLPKLGAALDLTEVNEKLGVYRNGIQAGLKFNETGLTPETHKALMRSISLATS